MANFLESLGMGGGIDVHISISPACGIEMTTLDAHGNVKSYAQMPLDYNEAQREVSNYDDLLKHCFKCVILTLKNLMCM